MHHYLRETVIHFYDDGVCRCQGWKVLYLWNICVYSLISVFLFFCVRQSSRRYYNGISCTKKINIYFKTSYITHISRIRQYYKTKFWYIWKNYWLKNELFSLVTWVILVNTRMIMFFVSLQKWSHFSKEYLSSIVLLMIYRKDLGKVIKILAEMGWITLCIHYPLFVRFSRIRALNTLL